MKAFNGLSLTLLLLIFLSSSSLPYSPEPKPASIIQWTIYEIAEDITGAPAHILRGIAIAESNEDDAAIGDDGISKGRMQINELYHEERAKKYGEYNPHDPQESVVLAGFILMENLARLGNMDTAIAAYRQGVFGVKENGPTQWYIDKVKEAQE